MRDIIALIGNVFLLERTFHAARICAVKGDVIKSACTLCAGSDRDAEFV